MYSSTEATIQQPTPTNSLEHVVAFVFDLFVGIIFAGFVLYSIFMWLRVKILADTVNAKANRIIVMLAFVYVLISIGVLIVALLILSA